jgi:hypothetical protein
MEDFGSDTDSDYTSYWRDWVGTSTLIHFLDLFVDISYILLYTHIPSTTALDMGNALADLAGDYRIVIYHRKRLKHRKGVSTLRDLFIDNTSSADDPFWFRVRYARRHIRRDQQRPTQALAIHTSSLSAVAIHTRTMPY